MNQPTAPETKPDGDIAALAKGGRTNFFGFLLRLAARIPFLFIAGRFYGPEALGRFASALVIVELASQIATMGQKRGLAAQMSRGDQPDAHIIADGMVLSIFTGGIMAAALLLFPWPMFPSGQFTRIDRLLPLAIIPFTLTDIALAALAYRYDIGSSVKARSVVEPWVLSIGAAAAALVVPQSGLAVAYLASIFLAALAAFIPLVRQYGWPKHWTPHPGRLARLAWVNLPLAAADMVEWGTRKLDIAILGLLASPTAVGVYYVAQQVASLPQKLKTSFEPILGPVITRNLKERNYAAIARQVCQVGFWITAAQAGIALALGIPGEAVMGLIGPNFVGGTGALAFLLAAEVVAATAVVSEAALVYVARIRNLWVSLGTIVLQAALTVGLIEIVDKSGLGELYRSAAAALALAISLGVASLIKGVILSRILGQSINNWRWALLYAAGPAIVVGWLVTHLPEWLELTLGVPLILFTYGFIIWRHGFGPEDRILFRKNVVHLDDETDGKAAT